jgi:16S rRNA (cytosine1402-N4)-methyltransferase
MDPTQRRADGKNGGTYVDCTFGRGGHTKAILARLAEDGKLFAFDVDPEAVSVARELERADPRFHIIHRPFGDLAEALEGVAVNGVLADLGVSSPQLDDRHRGFNVTEAGPLDLRMNHSAGIPAREWLRDVSVEELAWVIHAHGEDHDPILAERIAQTILERQKAMPSGLIPLTTQLADIVRQAKANINDSGMHPAKLTFQAIRVFLNEEMRQLDDVLDGAFKRLAPGGRCCIISFKKKEANAITKFVREHEEPDQFLASLDDHARLCELFPLLATDKEFSVKQLCEPIRPSLSEIDRNTRSRSSAVHVLMKQVRSTRYPRAVVTTVRPMSERFVEPGRPHFVGAEKPASVNIESTHHRSELRQHVDNVSLSFGSLSLSQESSGTPAPHSEGYRERPIAQPVESSGPGPKQDCASEAFEAACRAKVLWMGRAHTAFHMDSIEKGLREVDGELAFKAGEHVAVLHEGKTLEEKGWFFGRLLDIPAAGWFLASHVMVIDGPSIPHVAG